MAARVLAVLAAVAMIGGAFVYRYGVPGGADGSGGGGGGSGKLLCAAELGEAVCDALGDDVTVEAAAATADRLISVRSAAEADVAGWLAPGPWPAMVDAERERTTLPKLFAVTGATLASAPIVAVTRKGQAVPGCEGEFTWKCLGDAAQSDQFRVGGDAPSTSDGLFLRAAALSGFFGKSDFFVNDIDEDPAARTWYEALNARLAAAAGFGAASLPDFVAKQGSANAYVAGGAAAAFIGGNVSFDVRTPSPPVTIAVTFTPAARGARDVDAGPLRDRLREAGWRVQSPAKTQGLPSPGVLLALRIELRNPE